MGVQETARGKALQTKAVTRTSWIANLEQHNDTTNLVISPRRTTYTQVLWRDYPTPEFVFSLDGRHKTDDALANFYLELAPG